jgi:hypothetical protein
MKKLTGALETLAVTFWVGGLWMTALLVQVLFSTLADRTLAGQIAGHFFTAVSYAGMGCGLYLVLYDTNSYAGPVASFLGCSPYQFSVRSANIGFAGPGVIKETTGIDIPPDYHRAHNALAPGARGPAPRPGVPLPRRSPFGESRTEALVEVQ